MCKDVIPIVILIMISFCLSSYSHSGFVYASPSIGVIWSRSISPSSVTAVNFGPFSSSGNITVLAAGSDKYMYYFDGTTGLPVKAENWNVTPVSWLVNIGSARNIYVDKLLGEGQGLQALARFDKEFWCPEGNLGNLVGPSYIAAMETHLLSIGDYDGNGHRDILYSAVEWMWQYGISNTPYGTYDIELPVKSGGGFNVGSQVSAQNALVGTLADVDLSTHDDALFLLDDSYLYRVSDGTQIYRVYAGPINAPYSMTSGDFDGDKKPDVLLAFGAGNVTAFKGYDGLRLWTTKLPAAVTALKTVRITNDAVDDIVTCCNDGITYALDGANGQLLWSTTTGTPGQPVPEGSLDLALWNNDTVKDAVVGSQNGTAFILDGTNGQPLWSYSLGTPINSVKVGDVNNDNYSELIAGGENGEVVVLGPFPNQIPEFPPLNILALSILTAVVTIAVTKRKTRRLAHIQNSKHARARIEQEASGN